MLCNYCGNNPIPHWTQRLGCYIDIPFAPLRSRIINSTLGQILDKFIDMIGLIFLYVGKYFGFVKENNDVKNLIFARGKVLWEEANRRGIPLIEIKPFGKSIDLYCAVIKGKNLYFTGVPRPETYDQTNLQWIDDKFKLKLFLQKYGFPVANGRAAVSLKDGLKLFHSLQKPVITKPRNGSRGRHTTTFIHTETDFIKAFKIAKQLCRWVMVEEHLHGDVIRATVIGETVLMLGGSTPRVIGDGTHTITELVEIFNKKPKPPKVKNIVVTAYTQEFIGRRGHSLNDILPPNTPLELSEKIGVAYGGTSYDCTAQTHPDTIKLFADLGVKIDNPILGFDFIVEDISKSYKNQRMGIIECNGAPFINLHYDPLYGETINAAKYVWDLLEK